MFVFVYTYLVDSPVELLLLVLLLVLVKMYLLIQPSGPEIIDAYDSDRSRYKDGKDRRDEDSFTPFFVLMIIVIIRTHILLNQGKGNASQCSLYCGFGDPAQSDKHTLFHG